MKRHAVICLALTLGCACEGTGEVTGARTRDTGARDLGARDTGSRAPDTGPNTPDASPPVDQGAPDQGAPELDSGTPEQLSCAPGFSFEPSPIETGAINTVRFSDGPGWTFIGFEIEGPGQIRGNRADYVAGSNPNTWASRFTVDAGGVYTITFYAEQPRRSIASCDVRVLATGAPPPIDEPEPSDCEAKVCGDSDGAGGTCQACPMVGTCLDPPSPIGPNGPGQQWACLDNAGCAEGPKQCVIWCPGEPCLYEDSGGCPQGVESCLVDPRQFTTYEEACASCCRARFHDRPGSPGHNQFACWDEAYNICRYPGDCGKPYPQQ